jgi:hypothetical protein
MLCLAVPRLFSEARWLAVLSQSDAERRAVGQLVLRWLVLCLRVLLQPSGYRLLDAVLVGSQTKTALVSGSATVSQDG